MSKDIWDKAEIVSKFVVPAAVAVSVLWYNSGANTRATAAQMTQIAVGILQSKSEDATPSGDALRTWAIEVLRKPGEIVPLSTSAAKQLEFDSLPWSTYNWGDVVMAPFNNQPPLSQEDCEEGMPFADTKACLFFRSSKESSPGE